MSKESEGDVYRKTINAIRDGTDSPEKDLNAFNYHVQHMYGYLSFNIQRARAWMRQPKDEHIELMRELVAVVPSISGCFPDEDRERINKFLKSEGFVR